MNKHIFTLFVTLLLTIFPLAASADNDPDRSDANIVGHVTDKTTGEHLPYINILLKGTMFYAATDATGHYFLKDLPEGDFILEVSCTGYKTQTREVTLKKGVTLELNFKIEEDISMLDGVVEMTVTVRAAGRKMKIRYRSATKKPAPRRSRSVAYWERFII